MESESRWREGQVSKVSLNSTLGSESAKEASEEGGQYLLHLSRNTQPSEAPLRPTTAQ